MKKFQTKLLLIWIIAVLTIACSASKVRTEKEIDRSSQSGELYYSIANLDSVFFEAFNHRNLIKLKAFLAEDLEFYHDLGGVTNYSQNIEAFQKTFASDRKVRRELVQGTLEVYPINNYGALETGTHRFYVTEPGQQEKLSSEAKFVQVWQQINGVWKITRIISYGHQEFLK